MAIKRKSQLQADITANGTLAAGEKTILSEMVESYEDIFSNLTTVQRDAISSPSTGLIIYNIDTDKYEYWNGSEWFGIGQNLATPITVKVNLSSSEILNLHTTGKQLVAAYGAGYAAIPSSCAYRLTAGGTPYSGSYFVYLRSVNSPSTSDAFLSLASAMINSASDKSGSLPANTGTGIDAIVENDALELKASSAISSGNGTLTVWVTYSIIVY